ncbi:pyridoxal-phosphate dependent enzyme [Salinifilum ghardaiensis]
MTAELAPSDVCDAARLLSPVAHRTPVVTSRTLDARAGAEVLLKCENLQRAGAFKFRGAYNAIARLSPEERARGVVAYSSGNHAQAVALAAQLLGARAVIVMPTDAPAVKRAATELYGAEVVAYDQRTEDRDELGRRLAAERGLTLVPPFDHPHIMAGQGTTALELWEQSGEDLGAVLVPVGGGGLLAGCATFLRHARPDIRLIGVEPDTADDTRRSFAAGERVAIPRPETLADGLAAPTPGARTFAVNRALVDEVVVVGEDEIRSAVRFAFERLKLAVEPSGAVPLAAVLSGRLELPHRVGVVVSGGNIGTEQIARLFAA